jgi:hypothetical protein
MFALDAPRTVTRSQLDSALVRRKTMCHLRLGDALVQENLITEAQRDAALAMQRCDRRKLLGEILVDNGAVTRAQVRQVLVEQLGVPTVNLERFEYDLRAVEAVSAELARKHLVMPLYRTETRIAVGIENPLSWEAMRELEIWTGLKVDPAMATRADLVAAVAQFYGAVAEAPLPAVADIPLAGAYAEGTFTIHIDAIPGESPPRMRFRIEGMLTH